MTEDIQDVRGGEIKNKAFTVLMVLFRPNRGPNP